MYFKIVNHLLCYYVHDHINFVIIIHTKVICMVMSNILFLLFLFNCIKKRFWNKFTNIFALTYLIAVQDNYNDMCKRAINPAKVNSTLELNKCPLTRTDNWIIIIGQSTIVPLESYNLINVGPEQFNRQLCWIWNKESFVNKLASDWIYLYVMWLLLVYVTAYIPCDILSNMSLNNPQRCIS